MPIAAALATSDRAGVDAAKATFLDRYERAIGPQQG